MTEREKLIELIDDYIYGVDVNHWYSEELDEGLADHLLANGVIVPPCKVGDEVYVLTTDSLSGIEKSRVKRMTLQNLQDGMTIKIIVPCICDDWGNAVWEFYPDDFGKTVFLTKEEAEKALKERSGGNEKPYQKKF